jgi:hypothetical protein
MTDKRIKNEQWSVKELISKIDNNEITKPKFQRKKKWDTFPKKDSTPNEKAYIKFLYDTENSVHAITFGQESNSQRIIYSNIDGNNRINAIKHFMDRPFEIFGEYLDYLKSYIDTLKLPDEYNNLLKKIFDQLSYNQIIKFKYNKYFRDNGYEELYNSKLKIHRDEFEPHIEKIQEKLKVNGTENFDTTVKINVNLFEGYNTDELCKTFEDINKYNSKLTETELLACRLHNIYNFTINNKPFETELNGCINEYYNDKSDNEVLDCYKFDEKEELNAHDFIVGFQNLCNKKYNFIGKTDVDGLSLFFKIWKLLYNRFNDTFTTENVNYFIEKINYSCDNLQKTVSNIFPVKINNVLFNKSCEEKLQTLKKNNLFMLISSIIGFKEKHEQKNIIIKHLEKCLIYHFFVSDIKEKDIREDFKNYDSITYRAGGGFIENATKNLLSNPETISNKLDKHLFDKLLNQLFIETNSPHERKLENGKNKNDKRRKIKFFEKTLMFYHYKGKIPTNMLENEFSIEHIMPNSSEWDGKLDKDRTGNLIPIISTINSQRGNKHINSYKNTKEGTEFCEFIKNIIPNDGVYNTIIKHNERKPTIINNEKYNEMCEKNEKIYQENFINCLFK